MVLTGIARVQQGALPALRRAWSSPLLFIYVLAVVLRLPGLFWGLPSSDGWDDDSVAPRDFLPGLVQTFTPGEYYTYPPVHLVLLTIATAPIWLFKLVTARSLAPGDLIQSFVTVPTMTALAVVARIIAIGFGCVTIYAITSTAELMVPKAHARRTRIAVALAAVANLTLTYYGQVGNLDGPYLAWGLLALLEVARAIDSHNPKRLYRFALYAALAVGTKDQAFALFLLSVPCACVLGFRALRKRVGAGQTLRIGLQASGLTALLVLLFDGALFNPTGFRARIRFLLGPASQDHAYYTKDATGRHELLRDIFLVKPDNYYPLLVWAVLLPIGIYTLCRARASIDKLAAGNSGNEVHASGRPQLAVMLLPALTALSFTLAFNYNAGRTEHRFLLPQATALSIYLGIALAQLWRSAHWGRVFATGLWAYAMLQVVGMLQLLSRDPRYEVERYLQTLPAGTQVEVYGNNVYLPRIPAHLHVVRAGADAAEKRGIVPGFQEITAEPNAAFARNAEVLVLAEMWFTPYYITQLEAMPPGYQFTTWMKAQRTSRETRDFLEDLRFGRTPYALACSAYYRDSWLPYNSVHGAMGHPLLVYRRKSK
jgi:hypothetical protein